MRQHLDGGTEVVATRSAGGSRVTACCWPRLWGAGRAQPPPASALLDGSTESVIETPEKSKRLWIQARR